MKLEPSTVAPLVIRKLVQACELPNAASKAIRSKNLRFFIDEFFFAKVKKLFRFCIAKPFFLFLCNANCTMHLADILTRRCTTLYLRYFESGKFNQLHGKAIDDAHY